MNQMFDKILTVFYTKKYILNVEFDIPNYH